MGSPATEPGRNGNENEVEVKLSQPFFIGQTEVTQEQWTKVMGNTPWEGAVSSGFAKKGSGVAATNISWDEAVAFCKKLTDQEHEAGVLPAEAKYTLPTEAQWEYACRAGSRSTFSFGNDAAALGDHAWWGGDVGEGNASKERYAHEVAKKTPSKWGLFDMHGNTSEWCQDGFAETLPGGIDPVVAATGYDRAVRGGSWQEGTSALRSASRNSDSSASSSYSRGFRVVRNVDASEVSGEANK